MAIQLARAIGLQGGIPQSNLPQMIQDVGKTVASTIDKASQSMQAKAEKEKLLKDAVVASMKIDPPKAHPKDIKAWQDISAAETQDLILKSIEGKMTPMQMQAEAEKKRMKLENIKLQAERDYAGYLAGGKQETQEQFHTDVYNKVLEGYPDTEIEVTSPVDPTEIRIKKVDIERRRKANLEGFKSDVNAQYDAELANLETEKPEKKIIKGQKSYFDIPLESRFESGLDLGVILEGTKVKKSVGALKALESYMPNFKPESFVNVFKDSQGVITTTPNEEEINKTRKSYIAGMLSPADYGKDFDIERKAIYDAAIKRMDDDKVPENQRADKLPEYIATVAGASFDRMVNTTIVEEKRKTNAARWLKGDTYINLAKEREKANVTKITESTFPPAIQVPMRNKLDSLKKDVTEKTKALEKLKETMGANSEVVKKGQSVLDEANKKLKEYETEVMDTKVEDYYIFSEKPISDQPEITFVSEKGSIKMLPLYIYKWNGTYYIGGTAKVENKDGKEVTKDISVEYDQQNFAKLESERPHVVEKLKEEGIPYYNKDGVLQQDEKKKSSSKQAAEPAIKKATTQEEFNKAWAELKKGESIIAPDGKTYKKK